MGISETTGILIRLQFSFLTALPVIYQDISLSNFLTIHEVSFELRNKSTHVLIWYHYQNLWLLVIGLQFFSLVTVVRILSERATSGHSCSTPALIFLPDATLFCADIGNILFSLGNNITPSAIVYAICLVSFIS